ncbi:hypothetical protein Poly24_07640 [Rosistilla carotiformis]|uniref:3-keto-alpha-glucoside-1,2-lyase/3-keto-2-hydroxy-glucal hydratase domain-containing protein n=1 Tax=Rosistilla carotiformis TaxID=2528017 RepID=A0A518JNF4_9BACT|nr:family 16 glycoside hydrolase [Rosistilla carotiformis]QDV67073.1 hypothetical protein Poly24_07640 [Rosistilla carotiformis]
MANEAIDLLQPGLRGWLIADRFDFAERGEIAFDSGTLSIGKGRPASGLSYRGPQPGDYYRISWEARRTAGSDFFCGLTFPIRGSHATLIVGGWGGGVIGISNIDNMSAVENPTTEYREFELNRWYRFEMEVNKTAVLFAIDGDRVIDLDHDEHKYSVWWEQEQMAPIGLATWDTASEIRKLTLANLDG